MVMDPQQMPLRNDGALSDLDLRTWGLPPRGRLNIPIGDPTSMPRVADALMALAADMIQIYRHPTWDSVSKVRQLHNLIRAADLRLKAWTVPDA